MLSAPYVKSRSQAGQVGYFDVFSMQKTVQALNPRGEEGEEALRREGEGRFLAEKLGCMDEARALRDVKRRGAGQGED